MTTARDTHLPPELPAGDSIVSEVAAEVEAASLRVKQRRPRPCRPPSDFPTHDAWLAHVKEHEESQRAVAEYRAARRRRRLRRQHKQVQTIAQWPFGDVWN